MVIGACTIELDLPGMDSLKQKRSLIKSLIARLHKEFNVTIAENDLHDAWQSTILVIAVASTRTVNTQNLLGNNFHGLGTHRPDLEFVEHYIELISCSS